MPRGSYEEEDEWVERDYHRGYGQTRPSNLLAPEVSYGSSLRRSRSTGAAPAPIINMYNRPEHSRSPSRGRRGDPELVDAIEDVAYEIRRGRSRTPGGFREPSPGYYQSMQMELSRGRRRLLDDERLDAIERAENTAALMRTRADIERLEKRIARDELDMRYKVDDDRLSGQLELDRLKREVEKKNNELKRSVEQDLILAKREREEREAENEKKRIVADYAANEAKKKKEREEADELAVLEFEKKKNNEKKKREDMINQIKIEEAEKKKKDEQLEEEWRLKLKQKEEEKKKKEKQKEEEVEEEMRKRLSKFGFQNNQIEAVIDAKKVEALKPGQSPNKPLQVVPFKSKNPTYVKIRRDFIEVQTLHYFGLAWEYDAYDPTYIVILQEMEPGETDMLFEHTRKLRKGGSSLLIEERRGRDHNEYAFVRRRKPSASPMGRRRSSPKGVLRLW